MQSDDENSALLGGGAENKTQVVSIVSIIVSIMLKYLYIDIDTEYFYDSFYNLFPLYS